VGQELEEWAHEQYFCTGPGTHTLIVAPPGASVDRAREQLRAVRDVEGRAVAICSEGDLETAAQADVVLPLVGVDDELLSPIVTAIPLELLALAFAKHLGRTMLGFDDKRRQEVNFRQIFDSSIPTSAEPTSACINAMSSPATTMRRAPSRRLAAASPRSSTSRCNQVANPLSTPSKCDSLRLSRTRRLTSPSTRR